MMAEVVELVQKGALDRLEKVNTKVGRTAGARLVRAAEGPKSAILPKTDPGKAEDPASQTVISQPSILATSEPVDRKASQTVEETVEAPALQSAVRSAAECLDLFQIGDECVVILWKLGKVDDWTAPILGAACKEILGKERIRKVVFDLSGVDEMSTAAVSTLIRFKNTIVYLNQFLYLVAGPRLRAQLAASYVDRMIDVVDSVARVVGSEIRFEERRTVRGKKCWSRFWLMFLRPFSVPSLCNVPKPRNQPKAVKCRG